MTRQEAYDVRVAAFVDYAERGGSMGAYVAADDRGYTVTDWLGFTLGRATIGSRWRVNSHFGSHMHQIYARIGGREYTGRGFGEGMSVVLRETAASKRARA